MKARKGDRILIESEKSGSSPRSGLIEEVLVEPWGTRYRVLWDDGHESTIHPLAGFARVMRRGSHKTGWQAIG